MTRPLVEVNKVSDLKVVGQSVRKLDVIEKVTGKAKFAADLQFDNMLYAAVLRSKVAHGVLKSTDVSAAKALPGVVTVLTGQDVPGANSFGIILKDEPVIVAVGQKIRKIGDVLAIVAAETLEIAEKALELINVQVDVLPAVFCPVQAMSDSAPKVYEKGNILGVRKIRRGDSDKAFADCDVVVEHEYKTQMTEHCYIEPEAGVAKWENEVLTMWVSTQNPHYDAKEIARNLNIPLNRVRVIQAVTGGGFGGKLDISVQIHLGMLAMASKRPVKLVFSREDSICYSVKRHPMTIWMKTGADAQGKLMAVECKIIGDTGAYASYGPGVLTRTAVHATGPYEVPNVKIDAYTVYTNNPTAGAMRGFGVPQVAFAHESQMDMLAEKLGISPLEIRLRNALKVGSITATGYGITQSAGAAPTMEAAAKKAKEVIPEQKAKKRGVGIGSMWYGVGNTGLPNPAGAYVDLLDDGSVMVLTGCADIGQGSDTALAQIVAEEIGVAIEDVRVISGDTGVTPDAGASSASRQTYISGNAVRLAAKGAKKVMFEVAAQMLGVSPDEIVAADRMLTVKRSSENSSIMVDCQNECRIDLGLTEKQGPVAVSITDCIAKCRSMGKLTLGHGWFNPDTTGLDPETGAGKPYGAYAYATQIAEVEVDEETGSVSVINLVAAHDVGKAVNPVNVEGQIEGGCVIGLGYGLMEQVKVVDGVTRTPNLTTYVIPTALDVPRIHPVIVEEAEESGPFGAKGVGEPALIPTAAAIANAIYDAVGVRMTELPITAEKLLEKLKAK